MANSKITDLTAQTTVHDADPILIVDTSDTSQSASGTSKQITRNNFLTSAAIVAATLTKPLIGFIKGGGNNTNGHTVPNVTDDTFTLNAATQTLTNKTTANLINNTLLTANTEVDLVGSSGTLHFTAASDGGDYNIYSSNGSQTLAIYGSSSNSLSVKLLDGNLNIGSPTNNSGDAITTDATQTLTNKTFTSPKIGTSILDTNGNTHLLLTATASAVNNITYNNAATGGVPGFTASGSDSNIHVQIIGKGNGLTKISILRQDNTTNTYKHNSVILTGWGFILGNGTGTQSKSVTFGITFAAAPVVLTSGLNAIVGSDPTTIGSFTAASEDTVSGARSITTTGFTESMQKVSGTFGSTARFGFSWLAIGEL